MKNVPPVHRETGMIAVTVGIAVTGEIGVAEIGAAGMTVGAGHDGTTEEETNGATVVPGADPHGIGIETRIAVQSKAGTAAKTGDTIIVRRTTETGGAANSHP
jgi:hypothetical protein